MKRRDKYHFAMGVIVALGVLSFFRMANAVELGTHVISPLMSAVAFIYVMRCHLQAGRSDE